MIIRILADNQYRLADEHAHELDRLDNDLLAAIERDDEHEFQTALRQLVELVQARGEVVPPDELVVSDGILPAPDMTLAETRQLLEQAEVRMPTE